MALSREKMETTGSELDDLETSESSRGKRDKIAVISNARILTLGANGNAYVCKLTQQ